MKFRLTAPAERDLVRILGQSVDLFGPRQAERCRATVAKAIEGLVGNPLRPSSRARDDIEAGIRSFHLQLAAGRRGAASRVIFYRVPEAVDEAELLILRILSDKAQPEQRVARAARSEKLRKG